MILKSLDKEVPVFGNHIIALGPNDRVLRNAELLKVCDDEDDVSNFIEEEYDGDYPYKYVWLDIDEERYYSVEEFPYWIDIEEPTNLQPVDLSSLIPKHRQPGEGKKVGKYIMYGSELRKA